MLVNGPLEIYATVIGAHLYDSIFNILASTGLAFLPFLSLFFRNITIPYENEITNGADTSLRRVAINFLLLVFYIMLFAAPTHKLDVSAITYKPACSVSAETSRFGDTGTTYDNVFSHLQYQDIRLPLGLALILNGASGITNAAIVSLPCKTDVQKITNVIDTTRLTPQLAQEVSRFESECYAPARAQFNAKHPNPSWFQDLMNGYGGQTDLAWIGSHVLQKLYYADIYPRNPVKPFPYQAYPYKYQDFNSKAGVATPKYGYPSCLAWWTDSEYGLSHRLLKLVKDHQPNNPHLGEVPITDQINSWLQEVKQYTDVGKQVTAQDVILHGLLYDVSSDAGFGRNNTGWMNSDLHHYNDNNNPNIEGLIFVGQGFALAGQGLHRLFASIDRSEINQEIPILQAVLMALCLALGPLILVLGSYRINVIFSYSFILSSVISITFVEKLIHYLEVSLHASQSYGLGAFANAMMMYNVFTKLYFAAPLIYLMLMSICGVALGNEMKDVLSSSVAGKGGDLAKKAATSIGKAFL